MANSSRLCLICGQVFDSDQVRRDHIEREHPGQRVEWREKRPFVVGPDGTATRIGPSALKRMRRSARAVTGGTAATRGRAVVRRSAPAPAAAPEPVVMVQTPTPDDPDAPAYFTQATPLHVITGGAMLGGEPAGVSDAASAGTPAGSPSPAAIASRESIRLALDQPTLAAMIRQLSVVLSEWDGAGERGHLSAIEAGQLAMLLHEPAISAVQRWFGGDVDRFRLALALGILLLGKGRIHLSAINRRIAERRAEQAGEPEPPEPIEAARMAAAIPADPVPATPAPAVPAMPLDPIEALAARQEAERRRAAGTAA